MNRLQAIFQEHNFIEHHVSSSDMKVDSYSFSAFGGCNEALLIAKGEKFDILNMMNWLGHSVTIYELRGRPVWWGYVHEIEIQQDALQLNVSLDTMVNRVSVAYSFIEPGSQTVGTRKTTAWTDNLDSQTVYGVKEFRASAGGMNNATAENYRNTILNNQAWPYGGVTQNTKLRGRGNNGTHKPSSATLRCKGWWNTLGWKYYANPNTSSVSTTDQIAAIIAACGQFIPSSDIDFTSSISDSEYRDGDKTALAEILSLMAVGATNGQRLLSDVWPDRAVRIYKEPVFTTLLAISDTTFIMDNQSQLYTQNGAIVSEYSPPVGVWCGLKDVMPGVVDLTKLIDPSVQFIEASSWSATAGAQYRFRGQLDAASLLAIGG